MRQPNSFKGYERMWYPPINEKSTKIASSSFTISSHNDNNNTSEQVNNDNQSSSHQFSLISYNILAQTLCNRQGTQKYLTKSQARWNIRRSNLLNEISHYNSDLISLQECDFYDSYWKIELEKIGYETLYSQQFNCEKNYQPMPYGLLTAFKKDKFKLIESVVLDYQKEIMKDPNITDIEVYEAKLSGNIALISVLVSIEHPQKILILSNTHMYWRPWCNSVRIRQAQILMNTVQKLQQSYQQQQSYGSVEFVLTGDFNTSPNDSPYILLTTRPPTGGVVDLQSAEQQKPFQGDLNAVKFWDAHCSGNEEEFMKYFPLVFIEESKLYLASKLRIGEESQSITTAGTADHNSTVSNIQDSTTDSIQPPTTTTNDGTATVPIEHHRTTNNLAVVIEENHQQEQGLVEQIFKEQYQQRIRNIKQCVEDFAQLILPVISLYTFYNSHCDKDEDIKAMRVHERWQNNDLPYTTYTPHYVSTLDYVFVSANSTLSLTHLLSIPTPQQIQEEHSQLTGGPTADLSNGVNDPALVWIPNDIHSSDHFSLGVRLSQ